MDNFLARQVVIVTNNGYSETMNTAHDLYYNEELYRPPVATHVASPPADDPHAETVFTDQPCEACATPVGWVWGANDDTDFLTFAPYWEVGEEEALCEDCYDRWQSEEI